ncbi:hypothetical protein NUW58_g9309 [Xylaria curta]|uniref:Uncharacterized protein n=1 Tax=Xylaria curta TaxID=42375 RepID=A0ACC1MYW5_9PEZI|nr:hypothetical protein NUW58_g9309 [Xylaria curta]
MAAKELEDESRLQVIHGDFWTGNVLLPDSPIREGDDINVFVIDWEMSQIGVPNLDLGQMVAELYELKLYKNITAGLWIAQGFLEGYGAVSDDFAFRTAIQVGAHLISFGTSVQGWGTPEQVEEVARVGRDVIVHAWQKDREWFRRGDLACLFQPTQTCFATFVASKAIKRLEVLQRETRGPRLPSRPQRYLLALSRGPSSTALLHILDENVRRQRERNQRVKFELVPVFVDVDVDVDVSTEQDTSPPAVSSNPATAGATEAAPSPSTSRPTSTSAAAPSSSADADAFAAHFPELTIHKVPLSSILSSPGIDWASLPAQNPSLPPSQRLADFFARLPSASARADVSRLLTRHALFAAAAAHGCGVVLLGYTTTSLAELTLSEAAKGRGFGIPWLVNDGAFPLPRGEAERETRPCPGKSRRS